MMRFDALLGPCRLVLLLDQDTGLTFVRLLRPRKGVPTFVTPCILVEHDSLSSFELHARQMLAMSEPVTPMLVAGAVRVYADRPRHVTVTYRDRRFAEGSLLEVELAVRQTLAHWGTWEQRAMHLALRAGQREAP